MLCFRWSVSGIDAFSGICRLERGADTGILQRSGLMSRLTK